MVPACEDHSLIDGMFTATEWEKLGQFSPLPDPPPSPTNRFADDLRAAALGQRLWFEKHYAGPVLEGTPAEGALGNVGDEQRVACADCHDPLRWFTDTRSNPNRTSLGTARTRRNAPSIVNAVYYQWGNWAGANDQFWKQGANLPETREVFNSDRLRYAHVIYQYYRDDYNALFDPDLDPALDPSAPDSWRFPSNGKPAPPGDPPGPWESMDPADQELVNRIMANCGKALEAYERRLVSRGAPFDRYVAGDFGALTTSAKRGLKLFIGKAGCESCHKHETFTDQDFHDTGVPQATTPFDEGRFTDVTRLPNIWNGAGEYSDDRAAGAAKLAGIEQTEEMRGQFRTKSLRHVGETGPYFHDGSASTLADVVRFYNGGGGAEGTFPGKKEDQIMPLNLSESEIADLVEFLLSLTGDPIPAELTSNTSATSAISR
jgi:cytochrome c peroxidase